MKKLLSILILMIVGAVLLLCIIMEPMYCLKRFTAGAIVLSMFFGFMWALGNLNDKT